MPRRGKELLISCKHASIILAAPFAAIPLATQYFPHPEIADIGLIDYFLKSHQYRYKLSILSALLHVKTTSAKLYLYDAMRI